MYVLTKSCCKQLNKDKSFIKKVRDLYQLVFTLVGLTLKVEAQGYKCESDLNEYEALQVVEQLMDSDK